MCAEDLTRPLLDLRCILVVWVLGNLGLPASLIRTQLYMPLWLYQEHVTVFVLVAGF